jgi:hypothetical protein
MEVNKLKIAILGSGVAGLLACKGLVDSGVSIENIDILTRSTELELSPGLHYLHDNCGLDIKQLTVYNYILPDRKSSSDPPHIQYSKKVGNPENNSVKDLKAYEVVYDMQGAHKMLHDMYASRMKVKNITREKLEILKSEYDLVISTLPLYVLYPHAKCEKIEVEVVLDEAPDSLQGFEYNYVAYNLSNDEKWYRSSSVNGRTMMEVLPGYEGKTKKIPKLIDTDYEHTDKKVLLAGRYGTWNRKYLAHQAYYDTRRFIRDSYLWEGYYG